MVNNESLPLRQSYKRELKELALDQRFRNHPKNKSKAKKADKRIKVIAGRLIRELERNLSPEHHFRTTLELFKKVLNQTKTLTGKFPKILACDRGYKGLSSVNGVKIVIPTSGKKGDSRYQKEKNRKLFRKRAGIEPTIGHLKSDFRMKRNFYKGIVEDAVNVMLAAAAYNFKRAINVLFAYFLFVIMRLIFEKLSDRKNCIVG